MKNKPDIILLGNNGALVFESCPEEFKDMFTAYYSEEFMFEFAKWVSTKYIRLSKGWTPHKAFTKLAESANFYTTKELLEQFKKLKEENVQE